MAWLESNLRARVMLVARVTFVLKRHYHSSNSCVDYVLVIHIEVPPFAMNPEESVVDGRDEGPATVVVDASS